jgi:NAD(P)-dependent dehydrogenase (short-subunit alcohol dehydrogenase family)
MSDDAMLREMPATRSSGRSSSRTARRGRPGTRQGARRAGADIVWVGHAEPWKKLPGLEDITALPQVTLVPLDLTNGRSVTELAGEIGGKVDIVVNNAEVHRAFGIAARRGTDVARAEMDINYFGLLRLAQEFGPALKGRSADGTTHAAGLGEPALGLRALELPAARHLLGIEGSGLLAGAVPARRDATSAFA